MSRSRTHTAVSRSRTHTAVSRSCTHKAASQSCTHTAVSRQLHTLHNLAISSSSSRTYLRRFRQFCKQLKLTALPASKHTVALFAAELSRSVAPRTTRVYLAAVSLLHRRAGLRTLTQHNPSLQLALRGMAHYHSSQQAFIRKPITTSILNALLTTVHSTQRWCKHDRAMLRAALCLAFYGFLRGSEFTTPSWGTFNPAIHATPADISSSTSILHFHIKRSKTDQHAFGHTVSLGATGGKQCPVRIIRHYLTHYSTRPQQPLFIRCSGKPLTLQDFATTFVYSSSILDSPLKNTTLTAYGLVQQLQLQLQGYRLSQSNNLDGGAVRHTDHIYDQWETSPRLPPSWLSTVPALHEHVVG